MKLEICFTFLNERDEPIGQINIRAGLTCELHTATELADTLYINSSEITGVRILDEDNSELYAVQ